MCSGKLSENLLATISKPFLSVKFLVYFPLKDMSNISYIFFLFLRTWWGICWWGIFDVVTNAILPCRSHILIN